MDDAVVRAMARWPNVPDVYGLLSLDRLGQWRLKGGTIGNDSLRAFISRNYLRMPDGCFVFQNGPQRVYVELEYLPWVMAVDGAGALQLHTGAPAVLTGRGWMDESGALLLQTQAGVGLVDDRDLEQLTATMLAPDGHVMDEDEQIEAVERLLSSAHVPLKLRWHDATIDVGHISAADVARRFEFNPTPTAP